MSSLPISEAPPELRQRSFGRLVFAYAFAGAGAMMHEVFWMRLSRSLLGADARAIAVALVASLGGIGLGAAFAPLAIRKNDPMRLFMRVEGVAAIYGALLPWIVPKLSHVAGAIALSPMPAAVSLAVNFFFTSLLLAPCAMAIGAGLPILVAARPQLSVSRFAGWLYGAHAFASAVGGLLAAFVLLPTFGIAASALIASLLQLIAIAIAFLAPRSPSSTVDSARNTAPVNIEIVFAAFFAGVSTLTLQTLWTRLAGLAAGPSVQGFAMVAALYVLALFMGSWLASAVLPFVRRPAFVGAAALMISAALAALGSRAAGLWPLNAGPIFAANTGESAPYFHLALLFAPVVMAPIVASAFAYPSLLAAATVTPSSKAVARINAMSAFGNVVGALVAAFVLIPILGLARSFSVASAGLVVAAAFVAFRSARETISQRMSVAHGVVLALLLAAVTFGVARVPAHFSPEILSSGPFLYAGPEHPELGKVVFFHEGVDANVTVRKADGETLLQVNGKVDGSTGGDAPTETLVGLLPALLAKDPNRALVLGLGTGLTAEGLRHVPGVQSIDVAEFVDGVRYAAPYFNSATHGLLKDSRVHVYPRDGALWLENSPEKWDVIVSQPSNPWVEGMGELFSHEAFQAAHDHLRAGGVFAAWFHVYATDISIVSDITATFVDVFPHATLWELARGEDYLLLGTRGELSVALEPLLARTDADMVSGELHAAGIHGAEALFGRFVAGPHALRVFSANGAVLTAQDGGLEARAAEFLYADAAHAFFSAFDLIEPDERALAVHAESERARELIRNIPPAIEAGALGRRIVLRALSGDEEAAIHVGERAVGLSPHDGSLADALATIYLGRAKKELLLKHVDDAREDLLSAADLHAADATLVFDITITLAECDIAMGRPQHALDRLLPLRRTRPFVPELADAIAEALDQLGEKKDAENERALAHRLRAHDHE